MRLFAAIQRLFGRGESQKASRRQAMAAFKRVYASFKNLLQANADLAAILADLNAAQRGERTIETREVRKLARRACLLSQRMAAALNAIARNRYTALTEVCDGLRAKVEKGLRRHTRGDLRSIALPISEVDASMDYIMGAKSANLGEMRNILDLPTPRGFALSIKAGTIFLLRNGDLFRKIYDHLGRVDTDKPHTIRAASRAIARLIAEAPMPAELAEPALAAWDEVFGADRNGARAAIRSSAVAEDGVQSFAGQYESVLNVNRAGLLDAIRQVIASLYSERAIAYRAAHGYALDATGMGILCLEMVNAKAAGVAFSRHPVDLRSNRIVINGLWGLGAAVVDGAATPDEWLVSRATGKISHCRLARKEKLLAANADSGVDWRPVGCDQIESGCLSDDLVRQIAEITLKLERHYQFPQDVEWAIDENDRVILLQTRPMGLDCASPDYGGEECALPPPDEAMPILAGGDVASRGVASGPVVCVSPNQDPGHFPDGAILVVGNSSPNIMAVLRKAGALIAETGSLTGHMASICREFGIPAIFNLPHATAVLSAGRIVTVDALSGRVYAGEIPKLLEFKLDPVRKPAANTPALALLRHVAPHILPLNLVDPAAANFNAAGCASLHDVMRFAHEKCYAEMFTISDSLSESAAAGTASKLVCSAPLDLYVIDLGGGLADPGARAVTPEDVTSIPFKNLLAGMLNPAVRSRGPRPVDMGGFLSVMGQSLIGGNLNAGERFGDRSYAIVSHRYLNFSSRIGYHYAILDTWCGDTLNKNYIRFEFAGGAAGDERRARRARCIGLILGDLGFSCEVIHDRARARFQKYPRAEIENRLDQLGRLLIVSRQMDMLMVDDSAPRVFADKFLNGEYF